MNKGSFSDLPDLGLSLLTPGYQRVRQFLLKAQLLAFSPFIIPYFPLRRTRRFYIPLQQKFQQFPHEVSGLNRRPVSGCAPEQAGPLTSEVVVAPKPFSKLGLAGTKEERGKKRRAP
ncbi:MAG: hypothetical protein JW821_20815 [Deltaproteobacteria bacterium]|nr:hypothetical protein [Deltaproteobacteria bacterium]